MTDELEDRLRNHLAARAGAVHADPDPTAFVDRSVGTTHRPALVAGGVTAVTALVAGAGVLVGVNLAGAGSSAVPATATVPPGRAGAALVPGGSAEAVPPSIAIQMAYTLVFTRATASGVAIRAYSVGSPSGRRLPDGRLRTDDHSPGHRTVSARRHVCRAGDHPPCRRRVVGLVGGCGNARFGELHGDDRRVRHGDGPHSLLWPAGRRAVHRPGGGYGNHAPPHHAADGNRLRRGTRQRLVRRR